MANAYYQNVICQKASSNCTFNLDTFGCTDYLCENIFEIEFCSIDSIGTVCALNQGCIQKKCHTAPTSYVSNENCQEWLPYSCILRSSGFGCQQWPEDYNQLVNENQCQLNLQDGNKCFWTRVLCKILECSDASKIKYTNNIECNFWLDYCIYNPISGARPSSVDCTSSPNDSMYDTHQECFVWNPKLNVISSVNAQGWEKRKQTKKLQNKFEWIKLLLG